MTFSFASLNIASMERSFIRSLTRTVVSGILLTRSSITVSHGPKHKEPQFDAKESNTFTT